MNTNKSEELGSEQKASLFLKGNFLLKRKVKWMLSLIFYY